ncbi:MAG: 50S ribosomal protein L17 [Bacteroidales bacterium]
MRHNKKGNSLGRTASHRKAMMANMAVSLIKHKRIKTTLAKAKALRTYVEPLITKSKKDTTHSRRTVFAYLKDKYAVTELFREVSVKVAERPGGYTRILKTGTRLGDNAEMCIIELVDYNQTYTTEDKSAKPKAKRTRRGKTKTTEATQPKEDEKAQVDEKVEEPKEEPKTEETPEPSTEAKAPEEKTEGDKSEDNTEEDKK